MPGVVAAVFVVAFVAMLVAGAVVVVRSDGRRAARRGSPFPVGEAAGLVTMEGSSERAFQIARDAIRMLGASDIEVISGLGVIGWKGSVTTNLPGRQAYEFGVLITPVDESHVQLASYARPRFSSALAGRTQSRELGAALAREVSLSAGTATDNGDRPAL